ncbi:hypothetical protein [Teichococcus vastitatis]|uniref:DUF4089 domain-containing protein n=1 Tax=Teichococcus vastitatis TaxID=2307076 RepID=A0ABS9W2R2_9PROT|nr:hypothetical protein [Pseudoroseomonas vastitatis]MCI0753478.1 hypothetical protein [Pseudoroseomonas vastitatis]
MAAAFLEALAREGIALPPERLETAIADALALHRQILLIRAACPAEAPLPLGYVP